VQALHQDAEAGVTRSALAAEIIGQAAGDDLSALTRSRHPEPGDAATAADAAAEALRTAESGTLAAADTQAVADSLLRHALTPLGATALAVWSLDPDGSLRLAGSAGFPDAEAHRWHHVPPGVATLARRSLEQRRPLWVRTLAESGLPTVGGRDTPDSGRAVLPAGSGGRLLGVLEISWPGPLEPPGPQIQRQVEALAGLCARTLDGLPPAEPPGAATVSTRVADSLWDPALVLRPRLDADGRITDFRIHHANSRFADSAGRPRDSLVGAALLDAYPLTADRGGLFDRLERVQATGEAFRAERMALATLVDGVPLTTVADVSITRLGGDLLVAWRDRDGGGREAELLRHAQRLGRIGGFEEDLRTGATTWSSELFALWGRASTDAPVPLRELRGHAHPDDATGLGRFLRTLLHHRRPAATAFRLRPGGSGRPGGSDCLQIAAEPVLDADGRLCAVRGVYKDVSARHWTEVALAATQEQLAHSEQQAARNNRLALQLQQALMPPASEPVDTVGLHIAVRYRPAEKDHLVGGDWYDIVTLPDDQVLLAVGDVAGHGIEAATTMVVLRNALRGLAATGAGPARMLGWLNTVCCYLTDQVTATAVCALYDPRTRELRWARAGHLPPVLIREDRASALPQIEGVLLGAVEQADYREERLRLAVGDTLLMYTDGLIEQRDRSVEHSLERLLAAARRSTRTLDERLDYLLTHSNADTDDDTCLIGIEVG
jgi:serine phosphatase RsbU (regulator of sigma subunit)